MGNDVFTQPEKRFLIFFSVNGVRDYSWCDSEEDVADTIAGYKESYDKDFCLEDGIEISSCRELRVE